MEPTDPPPDAAAHPSVPPSTAGATAPTDRAGPTTPNLATSWATPDPSDDKRKSRLPLVVAWVCAIVIAGFLAFLEYRASSSGGGYRAGRAVAVFLGPFAFALVLRFAVLRAVDRGSKQVAGSEWVPLSAMVLSAAYFIGNVGSLIPPAPVDASTALRISPPFTLREASPEMSQVAETGFQSSNSFRSFALREVAGDNGSVGLLLVADGALRDRDGTIEKTALGMESASGLKATIESIEGRKVAIAAGDELVLAAWIEEPLIFYVYAADRSTLDAIVRAVIAAPRT